jgi:hypothetical protein
MGSKKGSWWFSNPLSSGPPRAPGGGGGPGLDLDTSKLISKNPTTGGAVVTPPKPPTKGGKGGKDGDAPVPPPPAKDKPEPKTKASTVAGGAGAAAGGAGLFAGLGLGVGGSALAGVAQAGAAGYAAKQAADATKVVGETITKTVENITEFLSDPAVLGTAVGLTALVVIGPIILASITAGASSKSSSGQGVKA